MNAGPAVDRALDPLRTAPDLRELQTWARELGFAALGIADLDLEQRQAGLQAWLAAGHHGELDYMVRHGSKRWRPSELLPGTLCALMVTLDYAPQSDVWAAQAWRNLQDDERAFVSRYALGRDYHKVVRSRLLKLAKRIERDYGPFVYRPFCDSAPVMEVELARKAGLGWRGKHTLLLNRDQGSMFFIGTLYTSLRLPAHQASQADGEHCGQCQRCIDICPTQAITGPYRLDARRCISYLTIELKGTIPIEFRKAMGNRIYGCDDCQLACPWNKYAVASSEPDFSVRHGLDTAALIDLFAWTPEQFSERMAGSAIARVGYERWLRNLAVALGNALGNTLGNELGNVLGDASPNTTANGTLRARLVAALQARMHHGSALVREHVQWALAQDPEGQLAREWRQDPV